MIEVVGNHDMTDVLRMAHLRISHHVILVGKHGGNGGGGNPVA